MSEQDADRIRDAIQHDQTACRCGHLLAACADCRDWLTYNSARIARDWWWRLERNQWGGTLWAADAAEAEAIAHFESWR